MENIEKMISACKKLRLTKEAALLYEQKIVFTESFKITLSSLNEGATESLPVYDTASHHIKKFLNR